MLGSTNSACVKAWESEAWENCLALPRFRLLYVLVEWVQVKIGRKKGLPGLSMMLFGGGVHLTSASKVLEHAAEFQLSELSLLTLELN